MKFLGEQVGAFLMILGVQVAILWVRAEFNHFIKILQTLAD